MSSISSRLQSLQISSEQWKKKRDDKKIDLDPPEGAGSSNVGSPAGPLTSIKSSLFTSADSWKSRVGPKDHEGLTVKAKLAKDKKEVLQTPVDYQKEKEEDKIEEEEEEVEDNDMVSLSSNFNPNPQEFQDFFAGKDRDAKGQGQVEILDVDLDSLEDTSSSSSLLSCSIIKNKPKRPGGGRAVGNSPKKQKPSAETIVKTALEAKINFDSVKLKAPKVKREEKKLYKIKGRRHPVPVQVPLSVSELNSGDCFVLHMHDVIYCFYGEYANLLEKTKCDEIYNHYYSNRARRVEKVQGVEGRNFQKFISHFSEEENGNTTSGTLEMEKELGDQEDERHEQNVLTVYEWRNEGFCKMERGSVNEMEIIDNKKRGIFLFVYPQEIYLYHNNDNLTIALTQAETTVDETFLKQKEFLTYKKVKRGLEPFEFLTRFKTFSKMKNYNKRRGGDRSYNMRMDYSYSDEILEEEDEEITIENVTVSIERKSGEMRVKLIEDDPRKITLNPVSLQKYEITNQKMVETLDSTDLSTFLSSRSYIILWKFNLIFTTGQIDQISIFGPLKNHSVTRTISKYYYVFIIFHGSEVSNLDRASVSTFLNPEFSSPFDKELLANSAKLVVEEGQEPNLFLALFESPKFVNGKTGIFHVCKKHFGEDNEPNYFFREVTTFYEDQPYVDLENKICYYSSGQTPEKFQFQDFQQCQDTFERRNKGDISYKDVYTFKLGKFNVIHLVRCRRNSYDFMDDDDDDGESDDNGTNGRRRRTNALFIGRDVGEEEEEEDDQSVVNNKIVLSPDNRPDFNRCVIENVFVNEAKVLVGGSTPHDLQTLRNFVNEKENEGACISTIEELKIHKLLYGLDTLPPLGEDFIQTHLLSKSKDYESLPLFKKVQVLKELCQE